MLSRMKKQSTTLLLCAAMLLAVISTTGCQVSVGGQTLPSAYFLQDDIQYFPKGSEFKLSREAAALKAAREDAITNPRP